MKIELIPESGKFYKTNLHCHTDISDGKFSPEKIKELYKAKGYSAVCYTDHEVLIGHEELCDSEFVALHGYEVAIKQDLSKPTAFFQPVYHFNMIAKDQKTRKMPRFFKTNPSLPGNAAQWIESSAVYDENDIIETSVYDVDWINSYLEGVKNGGFLITYNHPQWSLHNATDYLPLANLHGIEVMNGGCFRLNDNNSLPYEQMLRSGKKLVPVAGDDTHGLAQVGMCWTMIKSDELTYDALISAYEKGHCYVSYGPEIKNLVLEDGKIKIKTSDAQAIVLMSEGRYGAIKKAKGAPVTEAEFDYEPEKFGAFFRIEVVSQSGELACSNAYFCENIK